MHKAGYQQHGFTIVELLVVIVVIGILAAITVVAYTGISQKAIVASLQSDLTNSVPKLKMYQVEHGAYPATLDGSNCPTGPADTNYCLKPSSGNTFAYSSSNPYSSFSLVATNTNGTSYRITDSTGPVAYVPIVVTGGTVTTDGAYTVRTFTSSGTLTINGGALTGADIFVVGGGGGGENSSSAAAGGGGYTTVVLATSLLNGSWSVVVGAGGIGGVNGSGNHGTNGGSSSFAQGGTSFSAAGGYAGDNGGAGGSGGGGWNGTNGGTNGSSSRGSGQGTTTRAFGEAGGILYAGGGGGGGVPTAGTGGAGGGANGNAGTTASSASANTGGGGGGTGGSGGGGAGGSGIVIIRYLTPSS